MNIYDTLNKLAKELKESEEYINYKMAKQKIFNLHTAQDKAIINFKNQDALEVSQNILSQKCYFNDDSNYYNEEGIFIDNKKVGIWP